MNPRRGDEDTLRRTAEYGDAARTLESTIDSWADVDVPSFWERYELGDVIGSGGNARVYRARDHSTGEDVAVKIGYNHRGGAQADAEARAAVAVNATATLGGHPGLVEVLDRGDVCGFPYAVLRLVDGSCLAELLAGGPLAVEQVMTIGAQVADCIAHVHDHGVVHRDIKPANILIGRDGRAFLTDFDLSRRIDATRVTRSGISVGTPAYMAPEQVRGGHVGPAADVYALGLVLLEAVTGQQEYPGALVESAVARLHRPPSIPNDLPAGLRDLLVAMTRTDPVQRPGAATVAARVRGEEPVGRPERSSGQLRRRMIAVGAAAAAAAWVVVVAVQATPDGGIAAVPPDAPRAAEGGPAPAAPLPSTPAGDLLPSMGTAASQIGAGRADTGVATTARPDPGSASEATGHGRGNAVGRDADTGGKGRGPKKGNGG